jgi:hypothetical protein
VLEDYYTRKNAGIQPFAWKFAKSVSFSVKKASAPRLLARKLLRRPVGATWKGGDGKRPPLQAEYPPNCREISQPFALFFV